MKEKKKETEKVPFHLDQNFFTSFLNIKIFISKEKIFLKFLNKDFKTFHYSVSINYFFSSLNQI